MRDGEARRRFFARLSERAERALVLSEGLLIYLAPEEVGSLAQDLHGAHSFRFWLIDIASPKVFKIMNRSWGKHLQAAGARFRFAPAEGGEFFRPYGWREVEFHNLLEESRRLNRRMPMDGWIRFWEKVAPRRTARKLKQWRSGPLLLARIESA